MRDHGTDVPDREPHPAVSMSSRPEMRHGSSSSTKTCSRCRSPCTTCFVAVAQPIDRRPIAS
ncbi:hypothetical protein P9139_10690 [Curtobacterium flaccumfaciens]|nr:hypothetical protein P9139_10690 [Curtobacterium flaccumfaciens]